jgi:hypothetical protein
MLTKIIFVLVIFGADGSAQRFAQFDSAEQCQRFADTYNAGNRNFGRANCMPENVQAEADIDAAMAKMFAVMNKMKQEMEKNETVSNQRSTP